jgi:hypothetical protein
VPEEWPQSDGEWVAEAYQNIFEVPAEALPATEAVLTMMGGKIIWDSAR